MLGEGLVSFSEFIRVMDVFLTECEVDQMIEPIVSAEVKNLDAFSTALSCRYPRCAVVFTTTHTSIYQKNCMYSAIFGRIALR